jgi:hypothetical protein
MCQLGAEETLSQLYELKLCEKKGSISYLLQFPLYSLDKTID